MFLTIKCLKNFIQLEGDGTGTFTGEIVIPPSAKQISIGLSKTGKGSYEILAIYEVK